MKFKLVALAACSLCTMAYAQTSNVTIFGLADAGITSVSGYKQGRVLALSSGIMEGSRWGIRTSEDLGGGYRALVTLESRFELDTGSVTNRPGSGTQIPDRITAGLPTAVATGAAGAIGAGVGVNVSGKLFDRQAFIGLVTPIGGILAGRQYTPAFETVGTFDIMETQSSLSAGQIAGIPAGLDIRYDNSLQYRIVQGPWNAALFYGLGELSGNANNRLLGFNTIYKSNSFSAGFGYNTKKNSAGQQALKSTVVGGSYKLGNIKLSSMYLRIQEPNASSGPELTAGLTGAGIPATLVATIVDRLKQDANVFHIGARYDMGAVGQVTVAYNKLNDKRASNADTASFGVAYTYPLSKRTNLNAVLTRFNNSGSGQAAPGGNGYLGGVTSSAGTDATSIAFGIRHSF